ncbi:hypothetical protein T484DRAFT_1760639 [Baffinella frigidus]|nr:hypothetical protein T484DRAFT_1760639 [Cryptophyta sp. CCMP2293]
MMVPACKEAMRAQALSLQGQHVAIPLVLTRGSSTIPFGVIAMVVPGGDVQLDALPGIASALASALAGSQWRRKLKACGMEGLASLLKRAPNIKGAYLAFPDVGGRQVCAGVIGEEVSSHVQTGKLVEDTTGLQVTAIQAEGGPILGYIGVNEAGVKVSDDEGDSDAWEVMKDVGWTLATVMKDVGWTLATVSGVIEAQGALFDKSGEEALRSEEALASHFNAARFKLMTATTIATVFKLVTATTIAAVSLPYMDSVKVASQPALGVVAIMQGIMYILGHQHRDVSEWPKCRKLITHHIFKMRF